MVIDGIHIELDVYDYLASKGLRKIQVTGGNVMACCPFHTESTPSFGVNSVTGVFNCFGCGSKGSFQRLVQQLDGYDTIYDATVYLMSVYGKYATIVDEPIQLDFPDEVVPLEHCLPEHTLDPYRFRHPYLEGRGITEKWQRIFEIGYDKQKRAITFPYRSERGQLLTVKFRSTYDKSFWYEPTMARRTKAETLYGLDRVLKWNLRVVAITEAEIDCIAVWQAELVGAIAIGGNQFSDEQAQKLLKSLDNDTELIVFTDNDKGGEHAKEMVTAKLSGRFPISCVDYGLISRTVKDANDLSVEEVRMLLEARSRVPLPLHFT